MALEDRLHTVWLTLQLRSFRNLPAAADAMRPQVAAAAVAVAIAAVSARALVKLIFRRPSKPLRIARDNAEHHLAG